MHTSSLLHPLLPQCLPGAPGHADTAPSCSQDGQFSPQLLLCQACRVAPTCPISEIKSIICKEKNNKSFYSMNTFGIKPLPLNRGCAKIA